MKTYRKAEVRIHLFLNLKLDEGDRDVLHSPVVLSLEDRTDVIHWIRSFGGLQSWIQRFRRESNSCHTARGQPVYCPSVPVHILLSLLGLRLLPQPDAHLMSNDIERAFNQSCLIYW